MPIKQKALLIILGVYLTTFAVVNFYMSFFIAVNFQKIEEEQATNHINTVKFLLGGLVDDLITGVTDYAVWDDSYLFVEDQNEKYINDNFRKDVFENLNVNYIMFLTDEGELVYGRHFKNGKSSIEDVPPAVQQAFDNVVRQFSSEDAFGSYVGIGKSVVLFGAHKVYTSSGEGPSRGYLVFARDLNSADADYIKSLTHFNIELIPVSTLSASQKELINKLHLEDTNEIELDKNTLIITGEIEDYSARPVLIVKVSRYREIFSKSQMLVRNIWVIYFFGITASVLLWLFFSDKVIFRRLKSLGTQVSNMKFGRSLESRVNVTGNDEITALSANINDLLEALSSSEKKVKQANETLKAKAEELEKKTEETEKLNQYMVGREVRMSELKKQLDDITRENDILKSKKTQDT